MIDDELEQEDLEDDMEEDSSGAIEIGPDSDEPEDVNEQDELPVTKGSSSKLSIEMEELPDVEKKKQEREALERAMQEFLSRGGKIQDVDSKE